MLPSGVLERLRLVDAGEVRVQPAARDRVRGAVGRDVGDHRPDARLRRGGGEADLEAGRPGGQDVLRERLGRVGEAERLGQVHVARASAPRRSGCRGRSRRRSRRSAGRCSSAARAGPGRTASPSRPAAPSAERAVVQRTSRCRSSRRRAGATPSACRGSASRRRRSGRSCRAAAPRGRRRTSRASPAARSRSRSRRRAGSGRTRPSCRRSRASVPAGARVVGADHDQVRAVARSSW